MVGAKTGPLAPGAAVTQFPPFKLWAHEINERGGLKLKDGQRKIELIEYDDHTQPAECIKAVERAATVDKADWISGMYATGFNLAVAPTLAKYGYPQFAVACLTDQTPDAQSSDIPVSATCSNRQPRSTRSPRSPCSRT